MVFSHLYHFLASQFTKVPEIDHSFVGQTVIVTGSNTGLGYEAAKYYILLGASRVILAVRSVDKGNEAKRTLEAATGKTGVIEVWTLDMSSNASIQEFVTKTESLDRIDVLLENAGMLSTTWQLSVEGIEMGMAVNVYGTIFLALLMIPVLRASARKHNIIPVITIVGSGAHHMHPIQDAIDSGDPLAYWDDEKSYARGSRYNITKLLELFYVRELARNLDANKHGVVVNIVNPGMCYSTFDRDLSWPLRKLLAAIQFILARQIVDGARTLVWPTTTGVEGHGQYSGDNQFSEKAVSRFVRNEEGVKLQKQFYDGINERLEKVKPGVVQEALTISTTST